MDELVTPVSLKPDKIPKQVWKILREAIEDRRLRAGDRLPSEQDLADRFQVSKAAVREALGQMEAEGLIVKKRGAGGGSFVAVGDARRIVTATADCHLLGGLTLGEVTGFRLLLEPAAVQLACRLRTEDDLAAMRRNLEEDARGLAGGAVDPDLQEKFHRLVADACHNRLLSAAMEAAARIVNRLTGQTLPSIEESRRDHEFNRRLYEALAERQDQRAKVLVLERFRTTQERIERARDRSL